MGGPRTDGPSCVGSGRNPKKGNAREMQKLQAPAEETQSYQTASSGMDGGQALGSNWRLGVGSGRWRSTKPSTGWKATYTPPAGIQSGYPLGNQAARAQPGSSLTELPKLPAPGSQDASQFGDWMTVVYPIMCDVAGSAKEWWTQTVSTVEHHYVQWLSAAPLEKLRMKPEVGDHKSELVWDLYIPGRPCLGASEL